jgi:hypothetical protein
MASHEDRLRKLSQRFHHTDTQETPPLPEQPQRTAEAASSRSRRRHSWYLDTDLVAAVDTAYRETAHALYPQDLPKSDFLEACLNFALTHLDEVKAALSQGILGG